MGRLHRGRADRGERADERPRHAARPRRHLLLGQRDRLDDGGPGELDACEEFLVNEFASHIKAFDSYPGINLTAGNYALSQVWNGDARQGLLGVAEAGDDPTSTSGGSARRRPSCGWTTGASSTDAENMDAGLRLHQLHPRPGEQRPDLEFHGYNTGLKGIEELAGDVEFRDMVFFTTEQSRDDAAGRARRPGRLVEIYSNMKAAAGADRDRTRIAHRRPTGAAVRPSRLRLPKFLLALPAMVVVGVPVRRAGRARARRQLRHQGRPTRPGRVSYSELSFDN